MDAPVSQPSSPLLTSEGHTVELRGDVRLKKERKECFGRVLDMSDRVIGSCGNEGRGWGVGMGGNIFRRFLKVPDTGSVARYYEKDEAMAGLQIMS